MGDSIVYPQQDLAGGASRNHQNRDELPEDQSVEVGPARSGNLSTA
jgi:hypothetical protein